MNLGRTVFSQLISFVPDREFRRCVARYDGDRGSRSFSCWDQFLSMSFAQLTYREGLRDIEAWLTAIESAHAYPDPLRRVSYFDARTNKRLKFLTNNFALPALTIAEIYRSRWQVELFFKWIKQHLRIKKFYGASENAVKTQIWIAVSVYVLVAIVRKRLGLEASLYQILQILSVTLFEKTPILQALQASDSHQLLLDDSNQLILFDF